MGAVFGYKLSSQESIKELELRESLVKKYFEYSSSTNNLMGYKCCKTKIPGKEINSDFTFYLYNIEGFFDFENGFFFTLQNLIWIMKCFNENNINTKSYEDFSCKLKIIFSFLEVVTSKRQKMKINECFDLIKEKEQFLRLGSFGMNLLRNSKSVINFLERIIPFDQFKGYVSSVFLLIEGGFEIWTGLRDIENLYKAFINKNYFEAFIYLLDGTANLYQGKNKINNSYNQLQENYREKNFTKAQRNLNALLNKMDQLFNKLKENNLNNLYKKNIVVLAIDETCRFMEDPDIGLIYVQGIEYYAKSLNTIDTNRNKFIMNMITFYLELKNIISNDEFENKDFKLRYGFMIYLKKKILEQYYQQLWNSMNKQNIIDLINEKYQEYYDNLNKSDDDNREIDDQKKMLGKINNKNIDEIKEKKVLQKSTSISSYSLNKKNKNSKTNNKNPKITEEEKKNHKVLYSTCANGFYKKKTIHKYTNNTISTTTKSSSKRELNYCKIETVKNKDKISTKPTYNFKGYRSYYKKRIENKNDEISSKDSSLENSAPPPIGIYYEKNNNF